MIEIGKFETLLFKIGDFVEGARDLRIVEVWSKGQLLTPVDTNTFLPSFVAALKRELRWVINEETDYTQWFLNYGETMDDVSASAAKHSDSVVINFQLRGCHEQQVLVTKAELATTLGTVIENLTGRHA